MGTDRRDIGSSDPDCPFCAIIAGRQRSLIQHRWNDCIALSPLRPATLGHTLIVPTSHIATIWELGLSEAQQLAVRVREMSFVLRHALQLSDMNIIQSNGHQATQSIGHLHVHLVPRYPNDEMGPIWPQSGQVDEQATQRVVSAINQSFKELSGSLGRHPMGLNR